ncbi:MAG: twin-arginine translocase TatA/TatE family subunit [Pegethrix bostrychoides GSE-TBD4-15B]|jgi:sec-independent protein translocase protein TatA|uniref:Sec-independent protein translocase protein TatA n=1 Tax=Pegethrix bostrychoides GSE-TBD4-15B TaxID=2839662 RepID=A0A951PCK2_9CYAN|nr:twin-arginine translocase TatA/TatE family subunit [Pegethrix bostrychoides GSE-TBD4-15B]
MFHLGWAEVGIIAIAAVLIFGPKKIPELGNALGRTLRGFKEEVSKSDETDLD